MLLVIGRKVGENNKALKQAKSSSVMDLIRIKMERSSNLAYLLYDIGLAVESEDPRYDLRLPFGAKSIIRGHTVLIFPVRDENSVRPAQNTQLLIVLPLPHGHLLQGGVN
jgi:hypothetical protein